MPYRAADKDRTIEVAHEATRERLTWVVGEIGRLDALIADWSTRVPDGSPAPPQALVLMEQKEMLEAELRALAGVPAPGAVERGPSLSARISAWLSRWRAK